jgi:rubrerythrin
MIDPDELPLPDWGLRCPQCNAPLAGLEEHRCAQCGTSFNVLGLLGMHRPIPDIGLTCTECGYLLTGLVDERCPECGTGFSVAEMLEDWGHTSTPSLTLLADPSDHHVKKRDPTFTGHERPLPEFGLVCAECDQALTGADGDTCPACGHPFDLAGLVGDEEWVDVADFVPGHVRGLAKTILYGTEIPYLMDDAKLSQLYSGKTQFLARALRVPREFLFDALYALASAGEPPAAHAQDEWVCPACNELVPAGFEVCWNCNATHPDEPPDAGDPSVREDH